MMIKKEVKHFKALYFDLSIKALKEYYSNSNPNGAYAKIREYLIAKKFVHVQYSGYHSKFKTTDLEIFDLIREMGKNFEWLSRCLNRFEVTNVGANHDLMQVFEDTMPELDKI